MDLQTQRSIEEFLRLSELDSCRVETRMEFFLPPFQLYLEYTQGRVLLSLAQEVEDCRRLSTFKALLVRCQPASTQGIPLRAYLLRNRQVISCALMPGSDVGQWVMCLNVMRGLLARYTRDYQ